MLYPTAQAWRDAPHKRVLIFAMSGLGKTHVSEMLAEQGGWFHYSVDYRIGTRHMGEHIIDNLKREAMKTPFLRKMLMQDLIHFGVNVHDHDLRPVAAYLGKPMSYQPEFLQRIWGDYLNYNNIKEGDVDPDEFVRWTYAQALAHRQPRYANMAQNFGITVDACAWETITSEATFVDVIADALAAHQA